LAKVKRTALPATARIITGDNWAQEQKAIFMG